MVWESLEGTSTWLILLPDPEGIALAQKRDDEIESGKVTPLSHEEFLRRTHVRN